MKLALDTEVGGLDIRHGCRPFFVSTCNDNDYDNIRTWEWEVNPQTRHPNIPSGEINDLQEYIDSCERLILFNANFDLLALESVGVKIDHLWPKVDDTLIKSHIYNSLESHKLKDLSLAYLSILDDDQEDLRQAVIAARRIGKKLGWNLAQEDHPHFPGIKKGGEQSDSLWAADMWLPRACWLAGKAKEAGWETVCRKYAVRDAERTLYLDLFYNTQLEHLNLTGIYEDQRRLIEAVYTMQAHGITIRKSEIKNLYETNTNLQEHYAECCKNITGNHDLNLNSSQQLQKVFFQDFKFPVTEITKKGNPATNQLAVTKLLDTETGRGKDFLQHFKAYGEHGSILRYIKKYDARSSTQTSVHQERLYRYKKIHFNFNQTGTATTRFSSDGAQNISKKVKPCFWCADQKTIGCDKCKGTGWSNLSLRSAFGPKRGRVWVSADYSNIEMRILARKAEVQSFLDIFREGKTTVHLAVAEHIFSEECHKPDFKKTDFYRQVKNGNFGVSYGAGQEKADNTYKKPGAYEKLLYEYPDVRNFQKLLQELKHRVRKTGIIETLGGYPLVVPTSKPYAVLNYFVQGSAGIVMKRAITNCHEWIKANPNRDVKMIITVHDELVFDLPAPTQETHTKLLSGEIPEKGDIFIDTVRQLCYNMEKPGDDEDFGINLPVEPEYHPVSWAEGKDLCSILN